MARVLVVDDRPVNRDLVRTLLVHRGHQVVEAGDGAEALRQARREPPDLVITDVLMPGMDGCELVRELRALPDTAQIPVVFYTANYLEDEVRPIADAYGVASVLPKTSDPRVVLGTIDRLLGGAPVSPPPPTPDPEAVQKHLQTVSAKLVQKVRELEAKEDALRESEERFRRMAESAPVGMFLGDAEAHAVYVNPRFAEIVGRPAADLLGHRWRDRVGLPADAFDAAVLGGGTQAPPARRRCRAVRPDGSDQWLDVSLSVVWDGDGRRFATIGTIDDVTSVVEAETRKQELDARLQATERLESLGRLAGGVAHDFNNLLTVILASARFAHEAGMRGIAAGQVGDELGRALLDDLDRVLEAGNRAVNLTAQLLTFGRRDLVQPSVVDLNEVLREISELLERTLGEHVEIVHSLQPGLWPIRADAGQLGQIVLNLAVNARDAMPSGGLLTLCTSNLDTVEAPDQAQGTDLPPGRYVRFTVSDTGHGMPPEVVERALDPFFTTKLPGEGTGLGLATVYGIVTRSGGQVRLRSAVGQGTAVDLFVPAAERAARPAREPSTLDDGAPGGTETILVVDDEPGICDASRRILTGAGYRVSAHTSGQAAVDAVLAGQRIDLLLTDVVMPRMSGPDLARQVKLLQPEARVLYMSGYADALLDNQGTLEPGITVLSKPFSAPALLHTVRAVLESVPAG